VLNSNRLHVPNPLVDLSTFQGLPILHLRHELAVTRLESTHWNVRNWRIWLCVSIKYFLSKRIAKEDKMGVHTRRSMVKQFDIWGFSASPSLGFRV